MIFCSAPLNLLERMGVQFEAHRVCSVPVSYSLLFFPTVRDNLVSVA